MPLKMTELRQQVARDRRNWNQALAWSLVGHGLAWGLLLTGTIMIIGRVSGQRWDWVALLIGIGAGLIWAAWQWRQRAVNDEQIATLLDMRAGGTGLLLFELEAGPDAVRACANRLPSATQRSMLTQPRPDVRRILKRVAPGLLFLLAASLLPVRAVASHGVDPISERRIEELQMLAEALDESLELEEQLREEIQQNLEALKSESNPDQPQGEALREALDQLEARLQDAANQEAQQLEEQLRQSAEAGNQAGAEDPMQRENALDMLGDLAEQMKEDGTLPEMPLSPEMLADLLENGLPQEFLDELQKLAESGMLDQMGQLARGMQLDPALARMLAEQLSGALSEAALQKLAEMVKKGMLGQTEGGEGMKMAMGQGMPSLEELEAMLMRGQGLTPGQGGVPLPIPGTGSGITRGPGSVPLTWGNETPDLREQMQWNSMAAPDSPEEAMEILRMTSMAPTTNSQQVEGVGTADVTTHTPGETVWKRRMKPEHRQAVKRFFKPKE
jgi:hypothetical protein